MSSRMSSSIYLVKIERRDSMVHGEIEDLGYLGIFTKVICAESAESLVIITYGSRKSISQEWLAPSPIEDLTAMVNG